MLHDMGEVYGSVEKLLDGYAAGRQVSREPLDKNADSLSGSPFERIKVNGVSYVLKHLGRDLDWLMRALGDGLDTDGRPTAPRAVVLWRDGILDALPPVIDHAIVGASYDPTSGRSALLMRDISTTLVPTGSTPIGAALHRRFLDHMASTHATFWGFADRPGLAAPGSRYTALTPAMAAREAAAGHDDAVPRAIPVGWARLHEVAAPAYEAALALATDPTPLVTALGGTPQTLVHGDWKYGNLGSHPDGRTVLLDWAWPGAGAACVDLGWYLAVNCDRLPESKDAAIDAYRAALERHGVDTGPWWARQLELALLGAFVELGWSKTGDPTELGWWTGRIAPVAADLLR